ncbi:hypothetical protein [Gracilimonas sp. BCB1]|uniref:hypothetical protein n=1 Tax=Gracilimonas sp. BCB1 TaxID=3152362 RepID=UPI0032D8BC4F
MTEDFIGVVEITSIEETEKFKNQRLYKAHLSSIETYKGVFPDSILVSGTPEVSFDGQCEVAVRLGQKWLLYLQKGENGNYILSWCANPIPISLTNGKKAPRADVAQNQIEKLIYLKENFPNLHSEFRIYYDMEIYTEFFVNYNNLNLDTESAFYMLTFNKKVEVESVDIVKGFGNKVDRQIIQFFKTDSLWHGGSFYNPEYSIPHKTKYLVNMNYNKELNRVGF